MGTDLLFTTRYAFSDSEIECISNVANKLRTRGRFLFACTSISQINHRHIEPKPIPAPEVRFEQLAKFRALEIPSILAMRPFLPIIDDIEYTTIVDLAIGKADLVLGETWYADLGGFLERGVGRNQKFDQSIFTRHSMDFDENGLEWKVYEAQSTVAVVDAHCKRIGIPFFMHSRPAIEWIRKNGKNGLR
jgi:DNA repair photolyase